MEAPPESQASSSGVGPLISFYSNYILNRLSALLSPPSDFLRNFLFSRRFTTRKRLPYLPLPLPSNSLDSSTPATFEPSKIHEVLSEILGRAIANLLRIETNLQFWISKHEESKARKLYFYVAERGPVAFVNGAAQCLRELLAEGSTIEHLKKLASAHISERITVLSVLRSSVASFLAEFYMEINKCGEDLVKDPENSACSLLSVINGLFSKLESSVSHLHVMPKEDSFAAGHYSFLLQFEKLPEINHGGSHRKESDILESFNLVHKNLDVLDSYLSLMIARHKKPNNITLHWVHYTCGVVGLSVCSFWILRHSSLMGSPDIDNWVHEAKDSLAKFFKDRVEQPVLAIRDELFETFRKGQKGLVEIKEVELTTQSLHRMLLAFSEQTQGKKFPENASDLEMLEIVMSRYEKEVAHPIQNLFSGELARALLIQVQKLKLNIEMAMLEMDQILRANEINFAVLAALPAFILSLTLIMLVRGWLTRDPRAEGRGKQARIQRRVLLVEVEKRINQYQTHIDKGEEKDALCMLGMLIYSLDRLFHAVKRHAKATGEWQCLKHDIIDLARPDIQTTYKLIVTSRMSRMYECLPPPHRR